jgi:transposase
MPKKIYIVDLTEEERAYLFDFIKSGKHSARKLNRARILLHADESKSDSEIAKALHTGASTVQRTRQRFVEGNLEGALNERPRQGRIKTLDEKGEVVLEALAHSTPPEGRKRWTLQLLADRLVELKIADSISYETVRQELKKRELSLT